MADVKKINGYDVKDAQAREDISALNTVAMYNFSWYNSSVITDNGAAIQQLGKMIKLMGRIITTGTQNAETKLLSVSATYYPATTTPVALISTQGQMCAAVIMGSGESSDKGTIMTKGTLAAGTWYLLGEYCIS